MPDAPPDDVPAPGEASRPARPAPPALDDLRAIVQRAAGALERLRDEKRQLREENEHLRERVAQLEADPSAGRDGTALLLDDDSDALRERIDGFIDTLDAHLDEA